MSRPYLLVVTADGHGKRTEMEYAYPCRPRGHKGVRTISRAAAPVAAALIVHEEDEIVILTRGGQAHHMAVRDTRAMGRDTQGVRLMTVLPGDEVVSVALLPMRQPS